MFEIDNRDNLDDLINNLPTMDEIKWSLPSWPIMEEWPNFNIEYCMFEPERKQKIKEIKNVSD
jgi:hypothetical protein